MTIIKSLTAKGFKSFAKKTELLFGNKFNVILGPNGSGKSNVADALCFVLGKLSAKGLRAEKSANLIFNGGKHGSPAKSAEVSIVFDNSNNYFPLQEKEIKISRTIKQSGQSAYKILDKKVTRQQIIELLATAKIDPNGHNIILQGDIVRFMEMRPIERREIIEEVSGISVYEDKKQRALNDLNKVQEKLNEVNIVLTEREAYLRELKKDRDQALKYKELEKDIKRSKATYLNSQIKEKEAKKQEIESKSKNAQREIDSINKKITEIKEVINKKQKEIEEINKTIEERSEVKQKQLHEEIETLKTEIVRNATNKENYSSELQKIKNRKEQLLKNIKDIEEKIRELEREKIRLEKNLNLAKKEEQEVNSKLGKIRKRSGFGITKSLEEIEQKIEQEQTIIEKIREEKQHYLRKKDKIDFQLNNLKSKDNENIIQKLTELKNDLKKTNSELSKSEKESSLLRSKIQTSREKLARNNEELTRINARQIHIREFSATDIATRKILELKNKGVYGTVASLGNVKSKYSKALSIAAGARIKSIVVDNDKTAEQCINYLKDSRLGVLTFLPLNKIRPFNIKPAPKQPGVHDLAINLVDFSSKFKDIFSYVFGSTVVIDDIKTARKIGIGKQRMVTLEGDLIESSGAMVGGFRRALAGFKEKELNTDLKKLEQENKKLKESLETFEQAEKRNQEKLYSLNQKKSGIEGELIKHGKIFNIDDLSQIKSNYSALLKGEKEINKQISKIESDLNKKTEIISNLKSQREQIKQKLNLKRPEELDDLEQRKEKITNKIIEIKSNLSNINMQINDIYLKEKERTNQIIKEQEKERQQFKEGLLTLEGNLKLKEKELKEKEAIEKKFYSNFKKLFSQRNNINEAINKKQNTIAREEEKIKAIEYRINNFSIEKAKIIGELEGINKEFEEFAGISLKKGFSLEELKYNIKKAESSLNSLGNINLRALEVYEEIKKEYQKVIDKSEKLKMEREDVLTMMQEIDGKKKSLFMKTFNQINNNFKEIFQSLSRKGIATLEIEDMENLFESGVTISVKIIGKKYLDIRSLSGGEKTMAALAFIFSIQEYDPASFYFLDEVDAALDKTNSELLSKLINKYAENSQYIVITHNDSVITEADRIYGVSMQNHMTKVVSLKI